jgi:hypothetical protein
MDLLEHTLESQKTSCNELYVDDWKNKGLNRVEINPVGTLHATSLQ